MNMFALFVARQALVRACESHMSLMTSTSEPGPYEVTIHKRVRRSEWLDLHPQKPVAPLQFLTLNDATTRKSTPVARRGRKANGAHVSWPGCRRELRNASWRFVPSR
jgi:hypothetical protein